MARVAIRPRARRDLREILAYYIETAGVETARHFREAAAQTFHQLSKFPLQGVPGKVRRSEYRDIRMWRVRGFEMYLVFYLPRQDGIPVERVIHAARDYRRVLA